MMHPEHEVFFSRIQQGLSKSADLSKLPEWISKNTRNPRKKEFRWSFAEHEFQIDIARDATPDVAIRKCSQVGLSELSVRIALGIGFMRDLTVIYVLPTSKFASKFSKGRIDPVVNASPTLSPRKSKTSYSVDLKQIGDMIFYVAGASSSADAISIPAQLLVRDEYDFGNQAVLSNFDSRLGHNKDGDSFTRDFSTPTVAKFGIDKKFLAGHQAWYGVRHDRCGQIVVPKFLEDVCIPGFDGVAKDFEKYQLDDPRYDVTHAFVRCPHCRHEITIQNLADPAKRMWIAQFPDRHSHSYQVQPFDVPTINSPGRTLRQMEKYSLRRDWINFKVGEVYEDSGNSFNPALVDTYSCGKGIEPHPTELQSIGAVIGVDVGMVSWVVVGKRVNGQFRILYLEKILGGVENPDGLYLRVKFLMSAFSARMGVMDSMPDFNTASRLCVELTGRFFACEYAEKLQTELDTITLKEDKLVVRVHRNKRFDLLVSAYSKGEIRWCDSPELATVKEHLQGLKKTRSAGESEESAETLEQAAETWQKIGEDHYLHALNYCYIADELLGKLSASENPPCLPLPTKVSMGKRPEEDYRIPVRHGIVTTRGLAR